MRGEQKAVGVVIDAVPHPDVGSHAPIVFIIGVHGTLEYIDARGAAFIGLAPADICGRSWFHLVHPDDADAVRAGWRRARDRRSSCETVLRIRNGDGEYRVMTEHASPVLATDGTLDRWVCTLTDRDHDHEGHETRRQLDEEEKKTHALLDTLL